MKTDTPDIIKQFYSVINRKYLTEEIYNALLKRFDLDGVDLDEMQRLIDIKKSPLTKSRRLAVPEFIILRQMLREKKAEEELAKKKLEEEASTFGTTSNDSISAGDGIEVGQINFSNEALQPVELNAPEAPEAPSQDAPAAPES